MTTKQVPVTKEGLDKLHKELDHLTTVRRAEVAQRIHEAKELVGAQNTSEYDDARSEQAFVEGRIIEVETMISNAVMIEETHDHQKVSLGSKVTVKNEAGKAQTFTIVGIAEANPKEGTISNESPVGQALLGKKLGEAVEIKAPAGAMTWKITKID